MRAQGDASLPAAACDPSRSRCSHIQATPSTLSLTGRNGGARFGRPVSSQLHGSPLDRASPRKPSYARGIHAAGAADPPGSGLMTFRIILSALRHSKGLAHDVVSLEASDDTLDLESLVTWDEKELQGVVPHGLVELRMARLNRVQTGSVGALAEERNQRLCIALPVDDALETLIGVAEGFLVLSQALIAVDMIRASR